MSGHFFFDIPNRRTSSGNFHNMTKRHYYVNGVKEWESLGLTSGSRKILITL